MGIFDKFKSKKNVQAETPAVRYDRASGIPFPAYRGKEPYMFISYAHVDSAIVYPIISEFNDIGYRVWYDEGIEPGIEWPEEIANALDRCSLFVVFISPAAAGSLNVRNEINFALSKKLPFIAIYIKDTTLTPGLQLQMGSKQAILKYNMDDESFRRKVTYSFETVLKLTAKATANPTKKPVLEQAANRPENDMANDGNAKEMIIPSSVSMIDISDFDHYPDLSLVVIEGGYVKLTDGNTPSSSRCDKLTIQCHRDSLTHRELVKVFNGSIIFFPGEDFTIDHGLLRKYYGDEKEVRLPETVQIIGGFAFHNCDHLESVVMSDQCGAILENAFVCCPQLSNITIGKSFSSLSQKAFIGCPSVRFSYSKDRMPEKFDQLFPDKSIVTEIAPI